jgi:hypothetical protein
MEEVGDSSANLGVSFIQPLIAYRSLIITAAVVGAILVGGWALLRPQQYVATVVVAPTDSSENLSNKLGQLGGLASLAGVNLRGGKGDGDFDRFTYLIQSAELADWQIKNKNMLAILYPKMWDSHLNKWTPPLSGLDRLFGLKPKSDPPDAYDVSRLYRENMSEKRVVSLTSVDQMSDLLVITYSDTDPNRGISVLNRIVSDANEILRERASLRASIQAKYLESKLGQVSQVEYRETLEKLYAEQAQILMLTNSHLPYAAEPISGVDLPAMKVPRRTGLFAAIGGVIGASLAYFMAIVFYRRFSRGSYPAFAGRIRVVSTFRSWLRARSQEG